MAYVEYGDYIALYGQDKITETDFRRYGMEAGRIIDLYTTGIDNVKKLKVAFPDDDDDAAAVRMCACRLANVLWMVDQAEEAARSAAGYDQTENGLRGKVISSMSAGNESVSYVQGGGGQTALEKAVADTGERAKLVDGIIRQYLSGVTDANGVNLLYMGKYPVTGR